MNDKQNAISSFLILSNLVGVQISKKDLIHKLGKNQNVSDDDLCSVAKEFFALRAKKIKMDIDSLEKNPYPFLARIKNNEYVIILKQIDDGQFIVYVNAKQVKMSKEELSKIYDGYISLFAKKGYEEDEDEIKEFNLSWFIKSFFKKGRHIKQILFAAFTIQIFALITPFFTMIIIDKVFSSSGISTLEVLVIGLILMSVFDFALGYSRKHLLSFISQKVDAIMVSRLFRHITALPLSFFMSRQTGDNVARFREIESVRNFISGGFLTTIIDFPFGIIFIFVMFMFSTTLASIVIVAIILIFILYGVASPLLKERLKKKQQLSSEMQSYLYDTVSSIETIKSMSIEPTIRRDYNEVLAANIKQNTENEDISGNMQAISNFINKLTVALCLWIGAIGVLDGTMSAGQLIAFNMLIGRIMSPAQRIASSLQQIYQVKLSAKRVNDIFSTKIETAILNTNTSLPDIKGAITFADISFKYKEDNPFVLNRLSFSIKECDIVGIVGKTGSGKTTVTRLIQRLYTPTSGKILIDGMDISSADPNWLRRQIGVVMQDNVLLNKSIKDNIMLANSSASIEDVKEVCKISGADEFILTLPNTYNEIVGERGANLSTGQRQRIAIARALINNPRILIFDEATSAVDFENELIIQKNMNKICKGRTVIIVSHKLSILKVVNKIFSLSNGNVIESGSKEELLKNKNSYFYNMCKAQEILSHI